MKISLNARIASMTGIRDTIDAGAGAGKIRLYTAPQPTTGGAAITSQTLLGECVLSDPCGTVSGTTGELNFSAISNDVSADASGIIGWARVLDSNNNYVLDLSAGITGSGAEVTFNTNEALAGGIVQMTSGKLSWNSSVI